MKKIKSKINFLIGFFLVLLVMPLTSTSDIPVAFANSYEGSGCIFFSDVIKGRVGYPDDESGCPALYGIFPDGNYQRVLQAHPTKLEKYYASAGCLYPHMNWSGDTIVFCDKSQHIVVADCKNRPEMVITTGFRNLELIGDHPSLSSDGSKLVFREYYRPYEHVPDLIDKNLVITDGTVKKVLQRDIDEVQISPDGNLIAFTKKDKLYVMNSDGSNTHAITNAFDSVQGLAWSPDGQMLAFGAEKNRKTRIWIVNVNGGGLHEIVDDEQDAKDAMPCWSPDGLKIAFVQDGVRIYVMNSDGSNSQYVTRGTSPSWAVCGF